MAASASAAAAAAELAESLLAERLQVAEAERANARNAERAALARLAAAGVGEDMRRGPSPPKQPATSGPSPVLPPLCAESSAIASKAACSDAVDACAEARGRLDSERRRASALEAEKAAADERLAAALAREQVSPLTN